MGGKYRQHHQLTGEKGSLPASMSRPSLVAGAPTQPLHGLGCCTIILDRSLLAPTHYWVPVCAWCRLVPAVLAGIH